MTDRLFDFLAWPFVWRAIAAGVMTALCASLLGVTLVLRRLSFMGDGLSHVAFGAMAVSGALGLAGLDMAFALPITILCAILLLKDGSQTRGDAHLAMLSVGSMALGYIMMNLFPASSNISGDVCSTLFGAVSLITLTRGETWLCIFLAFAVVAFHLLTYHRSFDLAFDEDFARASGAESRFFNILSAAVTGVVIVVSMRLVGALLVSALLVFPAMTAMRIAKSFKAATALSALFSVIFALFGIVSAIVAGTPVGATIVAVDALAFLFSRMKNPLSGIAAALALALALASAIGAGQTAKAQESDGKEKIVVSIYPVYDWVLNTLGEKTNSVDIVLLQRNGADMHSYRPVAEDIRDMATCDWLITVGGESEAWVDSILKANPNPKRRVVKLLEDKTLHRGEACHHHHDDEKEHHACHTGSDEHVWLSLKDASRCVKRLAGLFGTDASPYIKEIEKLDAAYAEGIGSKAFIFADRFPFSRMAGDYHCHCIAAFKGCTADAEASFDTVRMLANELEEHSLGALLVLEDSDKRLAEAVRSVAKGEKPLILAVDSMQHASLGSKPYLETMKENLRVLMAACGKTDGKRKE